MEYRGEKITLFGRNSLVIRTVIQTSLQFKRSLRSIRNKTSLQLQRTACKPEYQVKCTIGRNDLGRIKKYPIYLSLWVKTRNATRHSFQSPRRVPSQIIDITQQNMFCYNCCNNVSDNYSINKYASIQYFRFKTFLYVELFFKVHYLFLTCSRIFSK